MIKFAQYSYSVHIGSIFHLWLLQVLVQVFIIIFKSLIARWRRLVVEDGLRSNALLLSIYFVTDLAFLVFVIIEDYRVSRVFIADVFQ